jgi:hypothetical protein
VAAGYTPIVSPYLTSFSFKAKIGRFIHVLKTCIALKAGDIVVFQFPLYARMHVLLVRLLLRLKKVTIVCWIGDIDGLRNGDAAMLEKEIRFFRKMRFFVVHTPEMQQWLTSVHPNSRSVVLGLFDFLAPGVEKTRQRGAGVAFAGNLEKSPFVEKLGEVTRQSPVLVFHLYGPGKQDEKSFLPNVEYHGVHAPYTMPAVIAGGFGLVWDGDGITACSGSFGQYLQYNSQHKLSLYLLSNLPVIIWKGAANATFIEDNQLGFTIDGLDEIAGKINAIPDNIYAQMVSNTIPWGKKIAAGHFTNRALAAIIDMIQNP